MRHQMFNELNLAQTKAIRSVGYEICSSRQYLVQDVIIAVDFVVVIAESVVTSAFVLIVQGVFIVKRFPIQYGRLINNSWNIFRR